MPRTAQDIAQHIYLVLRDRSEFAIVQQLAESDDAVQRRAQFVRDAGQKTALGQGGGPRRLQRPSQLLVLVAQLQRVLLHLAGGHHGQVPLRNIQQRADQPGDFPLIVADQALADFHRQVRAVVQHVFTLEGVRLQAVLDAAHGGRARRLLAVRRQEIPGPAAAHLLRSTSQQRADRLVEAGHHTLHVGFLVGDGRPVEKLAVAALAHPQIAFPRPQQKGGILQLIAQRGDFVRPRRHRFQRQSVRQPPRILLHHLQALHHAARQQEVNKQRPQRAHDPAHHHRAEQAPPRQIALVVGQGELPFLVFAEQRHPSLQIAHHHSIAIAQPLRRAVPRSHVLQLFQDRQFFGRQALDLRERRHPHRVPAHLGRGSRQRLANRLQRRMVDGEKARLARGLVTRDGGLGIQQRTPQIHQIPAHVIRAHHRRVGVADVALHPGDREQSHEQRGHGYGKHRHAFGAQRNPPPVAQDTPGLAVGRNSHLENLF